MSVGQALWNSPEFLLIPAYNSDIAKNFSSCVTRTAERGTGEVGADQELFPSRAESEVGRGWTAANQFAAAAREYAGKGR